MFESVIQGMLLGAKFLTKGGILILPILLCSVIAVALIIERLWYYHQARCNPQIIYTQIQPLVQNKQFDQALAICEKKRGILPGIFTMILQNHHRPIDDLEKLVSVAGTREIQKLERHVRGLGIIGHVTPLMGLLGTVVGMVKTFMKIADLSGHVNPSVLAGGIWEALLTTAAGLTVAIPVVIMYHYCEGTVEGFAFQIKNYSLELIESLKYD